MQIRVISLFPEMIENLSKYGVVGRAIENKLVSLSIFNPRDYTSDKNRRVDDRPYGGGPGMVMQYEPLKNTIHAAKQKVLSNYVVYLSAQGATFQQSDVKRLGKVENLILVAGRYEGVDERLMHKEIDEEISMGDFVVSGGELPAMLMLDALIRTIPGVLGHEESAIQDSFVDGMLDCPHYTRPESIDGYDVPNVLLGGDHQAIERWRKKQSLGRTYLRRPDLFAELKLSNEQKALLAEFLEEQ